MIKSTTLSLVRTEYLTVKERQEKSKTRLCSARKERKAGFKNTTLKSVQIKYQ